MPEPGRVTSGNLAAGRNGLILHYLLAFSKRNNYYLFIKGVT